MAENGKNIKKKKINLVSIFILGIKRWFMMLLGKGGEKKESNENVSENPKTIPVVALSVDDEREDSVVSDFRKFADILSKYTRGLISFSKPAVQKGIETTNKAAETARVVVDVGFARRITRVLILTLSILVLIFVIYRLISKSFDDDVETGSGGNSSANPTIEPYKPKSPSIYVDDKDILKIEEDTRVLLNEISGQKLEDSSLNPPELDMTISF